MQLEELRPGIAQSQAMLVDQARRASAAGAIAGVYVVITAIASLTLFLRGDPGKITLVLALSSVFYAGIWWLARNPRNASNAGAAIVATQLAADFVIFTIVHKPLDQVQLAYQTALLPLVAATTLRSSGVVATGAAGALVLILELMLRPQARDLFISPAFFYAASVVVATFSSLAGNRALRAHAEEEQRTQTAQAAARLAEARYELVAEHVSDLVSLFDADGKYLYASPSYERVLGVPPSDLVGRSSPELVHPDDLPLLETAFLRALHGETASAIARLRAASGEYRWFHVGLTGVSKLDGESDEPGVAGSARDITEQRELSEALEKTRRMEALGNLAGGVAHDFNNLLMVVQSCVDLSAGQLAPDHPAQKDLADVNGAVQRAAALTQQLLTFASRQVLPAAQRSALAGTAQELAPILARLCGKNIEFLLETRGSSAVDASAVQLEQLLMNLARNACDAMPQGGKLRVDVRDRDLAPGEDGELAAGSYVELTVTDTGSGMSDEVQQRIFEPFYTTKSAGQGTGLGLATVFGLVSQLHGRITVRSSPGSGSSFTVLLPASSREPAAQAPPPEALAPKRVLDILVVDDEAGVRTSVARMLGNAGHRVVEADAVASALAAVEAPGAHFDAIVTDVVIGADDGIRMLERVRAGQPQAAVVVMSGFSPSPERVAAVTAQGAEFLSKPFSAAALLAAIDRAHAHSTGAGAGTGASAGS